jgi:hypothetical protein
MAIGIELGFDGRQQEGVRIAGDLHDIGKIPARFSFGYLSLATQRKVTRPPGRDPAHMPHRRTP